jgi:hypothetical protein
LLANKALSHLREREQISLSSLVYIAAIADANDQNANHGILNIGDNTVIAHPIFPECAQLRAFQRLSYSTRIVQLRDPLG